MCCFSLICWSCLLCLEFIHFPWLHMLCIFGAHSPHDTHTRRFEILISNTALLYDWTLSIWSAWISCSLHFFFFSLAFVIYKQLLYCACFVYIRCIWQFNFSFLRLLLFLLITYNLMFDSFCRKWQRTRQSTEVSSTTLTNGLSNCMNANSWASLKLSFCVIK